MNFPTRSKRHIFEELGWRAVNVVSLLVIRVKTVHTSSLFSPIKIGSFG